MPGRVRVPTVQYLPEDLSRPRPSARAEGQLSRAHASCACPCACPLASRRQHCALEVPTPPSSGLQHRSSSSRAVLAPDTSFLDVGRATAQARGRSDGVVCTLDDACAASPCRGAACSQQREPALGGKPGRSATSAAAAAFGFPAVARVG